MSEHATDTITLLRVDALHESPFNPRKKFDDTALEELAADIKAHGRVLSPLLVRPRIPPLFAGQGIDAQATAGHEIVFGHRRYRAAELAGLAEVPCMVRAMSDDEARRAQISENLQRQDVHPIEEAEGFQALIDHDGHSADSIAEQFKRSRSYVYGRLKLLEACPEIRKACLADEIGSEVALLVARLRTPKLQEKALGYIRADWRAKLDDGGKASYRQIRSLLAEKFTLDLKGAMFDIEDEMLLPIAGNCITCPKRSSNAPEYQDIAEGIENRHGHGGDARPNVCTDPDCFDAKKKAHLAREAGKLKAEGKAVVDGNTARNSISAHGEVKGAYIALKDVQAELKKLPRKGAEGDANQPQIVLIQDPRTGKTHKAVKVSDVKAAGVKVKEAPNQAAAEQRSREAQAALQAKANIENDYRAALLAKVRAAAAATERSQFDLQLIAQTAFKGVDYRDRDGLAAHHGFEDREALEANLDAMSAHQLALFSLDCALVKNARVQYYSIKDEPEALLQAAEHYGINAAAVRAEVSPAPEAATTPSTAARATKKANAAPTAAGAKKTKGKGRPAGDEQKDEAGVAGGGDGQVDAFEGAEA